MIDEKLRKVQDTIGEAARRAGRSPQDVRLIAVTKEANSVDILACIHSGVKELGENRVKDADLKYRAIGDQAVWHLIGHLQTNKAADAVRMFSLIHSLDSLRLAKAIDGQAKKIHKIQDVLIEVNVSGEAAKFGIRPEDLVRLLDEIKQYANLRVLGLMTVTPLSGDPEASRPYFAALRTLAYGNGLKELSMGMTQDYMVAVEEGATMVRVGRAIFAQE
ncbi:MAG: YggS family pyridoxal phosphate-dependent enzyme [Candidatus Omnitrophica bacterium]|nr:YggS family pyridoxal phosphate-dependent enzyme [Candidatus Omnitrophota bacterium]